MAKIYSEEDISLFGPVTSRALPDNFADLSQNEQKALKEQLKDNKNMITKGGNRVNEKVKEVRPKFAKAVIFTTS